MTTEFMQVTLSQQPADARWGEKALLSTNGEGMTIHLTGADKLGAIQRAGRKIDGQGIKNVKLAGDGWDLENSWAFWQGYRGPKGQRNVEWAELPEAARQELDKRLKIVDWVRDTINMPAEELGPEQLATRAVDLMCDVGCDAVSYRITKGEDLREQNYAGIHTVGRGSERPPVLLALDFNPTGNPDAPVFACLVGKGITFDSGGYSLKQSAFMDSMKSDMGGAATITGALAPVSYTHLLRRQGQRLQPLVAVAGLADAVQRALRQEGIGQRHRLVIRLIAVVRQARPRQLIGGAIEAEVIADFTQVVDGCPAALVAAQVSVVQREQRAVAQSVIGAAGLMIVKLIVVIVGGCGGQAGELIVILQNVVVATAHCILLLHSRNPLAL